MIIKIIIKYNKYIINIHPSFIIYADYYNNPYNENGDVAIYGD